MFNTTEQLIPNVIRRKQTRSRPLATVVSVDGTQQHITFANLENYSNRAAWFLNNYVDDETFFYMGPSDIRYLIWVIAAVKTGKCVVFPSPGNLTSANRSLFAKVGAKTLLYSPEVTELLSPLFEATKDIAKMLPALTYSDLLSNDLVDIYPFTHSHMAASTLPSFLDPSLQSKDPENTNLTRELLHVHNVFVLFPMFHLGGMGLALCSVYCDNTLVLPATGTRPTPENVTPMLQHGGCTACFIPPSCVAYTGGPLNPLRGEQLAKQIRHLFPILASTEGGPSHLASPGDSSSWNAFKFIDIGQRMEEIAPDIYELVISRTKLVDRGNVYFHAYPSIQEYRTQDLFSPVKGRPNWWVYRGRAGNWVVMSNGLKMDPTDQENIIGSHPNVKGVLVDGSHRIRLCVLLELNHVPTEPEARKKALSDLWPTINKANQTAPKFGQVPMELVLFASQDKPFLRASKGTIQRRLTIAAYTQEIDDMYARAEEGLLTSGLPVLQSTDRQDLIQVTRTLCIETFGDGQEELGIDDDLLSSGLDSLTCFILVARLKAALRCYGVEEDTLKFINNRLVYTEASIERIATRLSVILSGAKSPDTHASHDENHSGNVIVLTGSTGSVGSYILSSLLARTDVRKVFCLNRSSDAREKQQASFQARGLPSLPEDEERLVFFQSTLDDPKLGLPDDQYLLLARETTAIIHSAYPVNFLLSIRSFEPQIRSLINLLRLAADGDKNPAVLFVSSITAGVATTGNPQIIREAVLFKDDAKNLIQQGYAQSKWVCEHLLEKYATGRRGVKAAIIRVGQVCGPVVGSGIWNTAEWLPSLVLSSKFLRVAPDSLGSLQVDWTPAEKLGDIISEIASATCDPISKTFTVYNVVNPTTTPWDKLLPVLKGIAPDTVPVEEWITRLQANDKGTHMINESPGLKLIDFYKQTMVYGGTSARIQIENLLEVSETARGLAPIRSEDMARWIQGWGL
ncbi:male sterility protein-domain-containing protein [Whalleya microplaca]|nr:male sterility protein-domain-containing protein [Whalleya microplaca]